MKYREPLGAERHVHAEPVAVGHERRLQVAADAVEHLELVGVLREPALGGEALGRLDHADVVGGDGRVRPVGQERLHDPDVRRVHVRLALVGDGRRLLVGALHEPDARAERVHPLHVRLAARQGRLQHDAGVVVALVPHGLEHVERDVHVGRVLHVDAHEEVVRPGRVEDAAQVVEAGRPVDVQAELRELQRDVALDAGRHDAVDDRQVGARGRVGLRGVGHALAELVERDEHAARLDGARGFEGLVDRLARDEPVGEAPGPAHAVPGGQVFERGAARERVEE